MPKVCIEDFDKFPPKVRRALSESTMLGSVDGDNGFWLSDKLSENEMLDRIKRADAVLQSGSNVEPITNSQARRVSAILSGFG